MKTELAKIYRKKEMFKDILILKLNKLNNQFKDKTATITLEMYDPEINNDIFESTLIDTCKNTIEIYLNKNKISCYNYVINDSLTKIVFSY